MSRTILLVHGAFSHAGHLEGWARVFASAGYGCLVPTLPGHDRRDAGALGYCTLDIYLRQLRERAEGMAEPPILIGHGMGGLLMQQLASMLRCAALVCVASAPPWVLVPRPRALPRLLPFASPILAGRPFRLTDEALCDLMLHDLPADERQRLASGFVPESGLACREMLLGRGRLPGPRFAGPALFVSGGADRVVSPRTARWLAGAYAAPHFVYPDQGHWLIAHDAIAERVVQWLSGLTLP